ncbi:Gfo/Idh/MocA family oxidoreductase (plasmid) [Falsirhodobacter algicola]|uniref:Gfo/Idh/MocA family oxidoreductase n=1 Tax=Falsirhodobacter algicola TaxID=2692330 RepID=A0A8J8MV43_9RHOB|nr:Gfo/Idh/MocA family oxidoreductase [Falsirhodobacter algicola]
MHSETTSVCIIGLGHRIASILPDFTAAAPHLDIRGVMDPGTPRMDILAKVGAAPTMYDDPAEMLARERPRVIMIGSPNHLHLGHIRLALESDAEFIFCEKPVVVSIEETMELARLIARHDGRRRLLVGLVLRYSQLYRALRRAQSDGNLGEIMSIEASEHIAPFHGSFFMRDWRRSTAMTGGFMLEKCCHDIDLYQGVVGQRPHRVASFGGRKKYIPSRRPSGRPAFLDQKLPRWNSIEDAFSGEADIIDYQTAIVDYEGGATMAFHTNLNVPDQFRRFAVIGTDGMAEGDFIRNTFRVTLSETGSRVVDEIAVGSGVEHGHYGADAAMARDIVDHIDGRMPKLPLSVIDALESGLTALAIDQARNEGRIVDMRPIWERFDRELSGLAAEVN